jgi:hypothetical protein
MQDEVTAEWNRKFHLATNKNIFIAQMKTFITCFIFDSLLN